MWSSNTDTTDNFEKNYTYINVMITASTEIDKQQFVDNGRKIYDTDRE